MKLLPQRPRQGVSAGQAFRARRRGQLSLDAINLGDVLQRLCDDGAPAVPKDELLCSVSADGAYDTKACHEAIAGRQAAAIIPTRKNAKPWAEICAGARARNEILRATQELRRSIWKKWSGYHRRSLVETKMGCFKRLGERVMARDFERQVT